MKNGILYVIITAVLFTTFEPVCKLFSDVIDPYAITAPRFFIGSLILLPFTVGEIVKKKIRLQGKDYLVMTLLGVLFICVSMVLLQMAVKNGRFTCTDCHNFFCKLSIYNYFVGTFLKS